MKTGTQKGVEERKNKIQLRLWDLNPQPLAFMDKGTTTCAKGEPEVVSCGRALLALLSGREQISTGGRVHKYSNAASDVCEYPLYTCNGILLVEVE